MENILRSGVVAILGRPSAGKSTFLNTVCGQQVSIVSPTPQTTRNAVRGIVNTQAGQLVFIDTPGYHDSEKKLNLRLRSVTENQLDGADAALYIIDTTRKPGDEEKMNAALAEKYSAGLVVALNKTDRPDSDAGTARTFAAEHLPAVPPERILEMSAQTGGGTEEVLAALFSVVPESPRLYDGDVYTDQNVDFRISEIIRGEAINRLADEIPHCVYVKIADMERRGNGNRLWVRAFLCVERESQKGIAIGRGASMIKEIRAAAQKKINDIFPYKVELDLQVKVDKNWRQRDATLSKLIPQ